MDRPTDKPTYRSSFPELKKKESKLQRDAAKFKKLKIWFEKTVEQDKVNLKGHVTDNCKGPVRELHAGGLK